MHQVVQLIKNVEVVQAAAECERAHAWSALHLCSMDVAAAIELAKRMGPLPTLPLIFWSAEVLSTMYPASYMRPRDHVKRVKAVRDATGADLKLTVQTLKLCQHDAGEAVRMLRSW